MASGPLPFLFLGWGVESGPDTGLRTASERGLTTGRSAGRPGLSSLIDKWGSLNDNGTTRLRQTFTGRPATCT